MDELGISGIPIVDERPALLLGIITRRDLRFLEHWDGRVADVMTRDNLVTVTGQVSLEEAERILIRKKVEKLLLVDEQFRLTGLITIKDIDNMRRFPNACRDALGRLRVGAAVGAHDYERAEQLVRAGVDVIVVDKAPTATLPTCSQTVREIKAELADRGGGRQCRYGRRLPRIDRGRCRRSQSGHWTGLHLHNPRHFGSAECRRLQPSWRQHVRQPLREPPSSLTAEFATPATSLKAIAAGAHAVMIGGLIRRIGGKSGPAHLVSGRGLINNTGAWDPWEP